MLEEMVVSGRLVDLAIAITLIEGIALAVYRSVTARGPALPDLAVMLGAGLCLMFALRAALAGASAWVPVFLVGALVAHLADLGRRWRAPPAAR